MRILATSGSLRAASSSTAVQPRAANGLSQLPHFNSDLERDNGINSRGADPELSSLVRSGLIVFAHAINSEVTCHA